MSTADINLEEPEETGTTFIENACLKAEAAVKASGFAALADDSGVVVPALGGLPGIYSARWGGPERDFNKAMTRVEESLGTNPDRRAYFVCTVALALPSGQMHVFEGQLEGTLDFPPRGVYGFGYCPIFIPLGYQKTLGEMKPEERRQLSARKLAIDQLIEACFV